MKHYNKRSEGWWEGGRRRAWAGLRLDGTTLDGTTLDGTTLDGTTLDGTAP
jgi:hypothetical protein